MIKSLLLFAGDIIGMAIIVYMAICCYWLLFCYMATDQEFNSTFYPPPAYIQITFRAIDAIWGYFTV